MYPFSILVNKENPLNPHYIPSDLIEPDIPFYASGNDPRRLLQREAAIAAEELFKRAQKEEIHLWGISGYRSYKRQEELFSSANGRSGVAPPGCSEHQTGLAIDLGKAAGYIDFIRPAFPYDGVCGRFRRLAARYGFIERYQRGKEEVTGISAEPWHFRYVGAPHAQLMETNGLCLEEYRDFLRQGPRSVALENGRMAQVFYVPAAGAVTEVEVPEGCCQISGDNVEGFILTWWGDTHENG